jgi:succinylarginine dihydrolase
MKHPQVIVLEPDGWLAKQLRELAGENRWLIQPTRSVDTALSLAGGRGPAVLLVQVELAEDKPEAIAIVADVHRLASDVPVVAVSDVKLSDADRAAWTAALLDLGARYVLFPPLTRPVLEDVVSGLMTAAIRRVVGDAPPRPAKKPKRVGSGEVIDLADEGAHE